MIPLNETEESYSIMEFLREFCTWPITTVYHIDNYEWLVICEYTTGDIKYNIYTYVDEKCIDFECTSVSPLINHSQWRHLQREYPIFGVKTNGLLKAKQVVVSHFKEHFGSASYVPLYK